jgi:proteasome lid subunit RPN8/RPN11
MNLTVEENVFRAMSAAARRVAPLEACGLVAGVGNRAIRFFEMTNADASADHFSLKPEEQFAAVKAMRRDGLKMLAIWHSHPTTPARMSAEDLRLAYTPDVIYLILSLAHPGHPDLRGYAVENGAPVPVGVTISASPSPSARRDDLP